MVKLQLQAPVSFEKDMKRAITHAPAVITCTQLATFYQGTKPMERCFRTSRLTPFELVTACSLDEAIVEMRFFNELHIVPKEKIRISIAK